jgi:beta-lactam-binding protein with PASTA domain
MKPFFQATMRFLRWLWPSIVAVALWLVRVPGNIVRWLSRHREWVLTGLGMIAIMLISAAITLRIALHVREVMVPDFSGMTLAEAGQAAVHAGVDLNVENSFYSTTVPAGRVLSQAPAPDSSVRHGWQVRVTVSLGPQQVTIPDVVGEPLRDAAMDLRRKSLDLGTQAHLQAPGDPDMVLAQTPPPNAGVDQPRVNLLLSAPSEGANGGFVMPSFVGLSSSAAIRAASEVGLLVYGVGEGPVVTSQSPPAGYRASRGASVRVMLSGGTAPAAAAPAPPAQP